MTDYDFIAMRLREGRTEPPASPVRGPRTLPRTISWLRCSMHIPLRPTEKQR